MEGITLTLPNKPPGIRSVPGIFTWFLVGGLLLAAGRTGAAGALAPELGCFCHVRQEGQQGCLHQCKGKGDVTASGAPRQL